MLLVLHNQGRCQPLITTSPACNKILRDFDTEVGAWGEEEVEAVIFLTFCLEWLEDGPADNLEDGELSGDDLIEVSFNRIFLDE